MLLSVFSSWSFTADHEFKMSVCEITYQEEKALFSLRFYLFQDDLKEALYGDPEAADIKNEDVAEYIQSNIKMHLSDAPLELTFIEMEERGEQVQVVLHSSPSSLPKQPTLLISNELLIEKFKKQTNMVYFTKEDGAKLTLILNARKKEGEFKF